MNETTAADGVAARAGTARPDGLAVAQLELLSALTEHPGARPGQLARLLHMRPNTVTTIVNTLTAQGMVSRATADADRRAAELTATDAGQQAVHAWQATNAAAAPGPVHPAPVPAAGAGRRGTRPRRPRRCGGPARRQPLEPPPPGPGTR